jgi:hypothetical protein
MSRKHVFTTIYKTNGWGCQETVSGPGATEAKTKTLRETLLPSLTQLRVRSVVDIGCGDCQWMGLVNFNKESIQSIQYIGVDIVDELILTNQKQNTDMNKMFQQMDVLEDPPETADCWIARDFLGQYSFASISIFFQKFLESTTKILALTSIACSSNVDGEDGSYRPLNLSLPPFEFKGVKTLPDDTQWFREKTLVFVTREEVETWMAKLVQKKSPIKPLSSTSNSAKGIENDTQDRNSFLVSNVRLRDVKVHGHKG